MYFILREEDTILDRWKAGLISSSSGKSGKKDRSRAGRERVRCYMAQLSERVRMTGEWTDRVQTVKC